MGLGTHPTKPYLRRIWVAPCHPLYDAWQGVRLPCLPSAAVPGSLRFGTEKAGLGDVT
jgi:hypothetical protein